MVCWLYMYMSLFFYVSDRIWLGGTLYGCGSWFLSYIIPTMHGHMNIKNAVTRLNEHSWVGHYLKVWFLYGPLCM
jgi:succinate-acetate transporter protein